MNNIREKLYRFMYGRYGGDRLNKVLLWVYVGFVLAGMIAFLFSDKYLAAKIAYYVIEALGIVLIFFVKPAVKHRALVIAITVAVLIPGLFGQLYFKAFFPDFGIDKEITALVTEINEDDYYYSVTLKCESIDGKRASNKLLYNRCGTVNDLACGY